MIFVVGRGDLSDEQWAVLEPLLPVAMAGRPAVRQRRLIDGVRWRVRTGRRAALVPSHRTCRTCAGPRWCSSIANTATSHESPAASIAVASITRDVTCGWLARGPVRNAFTAAGLTSLVSNRRRARLRSRSRRAASRGRLRHGGPFPDRHSTVLAVGRDTRCSKPFPDERWAERERACGGGAAGSGGRSRLALKGWFPGGL
ncbi:transposase [Kitasatospora sp. NPDC056531]|uniref:transposase n=1 Tax=Kitasatospora sp. NPDC056531 TaxID=3345856 RepID=UPI0036D1F6BA